VYPIFEGFAIRQAAQSSELGGEACSELLRLLLSTQLLSKFSSMPQRRQLTIARKLKEKYAFVAGGSFQQAQQTFGTLAFERTNVMLGSIPKEEESNGAERAESFESRGGVRLSVGRSKVTEHTASIRKIEQVLAPDGDSFDVRLDRERFYAAEVLFSPHLLEETSSQRSLSALVSAVAAAIESSVRAEICSCVLVAGNTAKLPGLVERLQEELHADGAMAACGVSSFSVHCLEPHVRSASSSSLPILQPSEPLSPSSWDCGDETTATWSGADLRMQVSLRNSGLNSNSSNKKSNMVGTALVDPSMKFKEQEFICGSEYLEWGPSVVERLLDDCY
jgi:actin-related protein